MRGGYGINESTAYRWMCALGYKYSKQQKSYYVDAHEREDVVRYRMKFIQRYLCDYEPYMLRWVQVPLSSIRNIYGNETMMADMSDFLSEDVQIEEIQIYEALLKQGRTYIDENLGEMIEFHVDVLNHKCFKELKKFTKSGSLSNHGLDGNTSVFRKDKSRKILISLGQDECIFKQFLLHRRA